MKGRTEDDMQQSIPEIKLLYKIFKSSQRHYETVLNRCKVLEQEVETTTKQKADAESERRQLLALSLNECQRELTVCRNMLTTANEKMGDASRELQQALTNNRDFLRNAPAMLKEATEKATEKAALAAAATKRVVVANKNVWAMVETRDAAREAVREAAAPKERARLVAKKLRLVANDAELEWQHENYLARVLADLSKATQQEEVRESAKKATEAAEAAKARALEAEKAAEAAEAAHEAAKAVNTEEATRLAAGEAEEAEKAAEEAAMVAVTAEESAEPAEEAAKEAAEEQAFLTDIIDRRKKYERNQRDADRKRTDAAVMKMARNGPDEDRTMKLYRKALKTMQAIADGREREEANLLMKLYRKAVRAKVAGPDAPGLQAAEIEFIKVLFIQIMEEEVKKWQGLADESLRLQQQIPRAYRTQLTRILSMDKANIPSLVRAWREELSIQTGAESKAEVTEVTEAKVEQCGLCRGDLPQSESQFIRLTCCGLGIHVSCGDMHQTDCFNCHEQLPSTEEDKRVQIHRQVDQENPPAWAQHQMGWIHLRKREYDTAAHWFRLAAEQGLAVAQFNLGILYNDGNIQQSYSAAKIWFEKAAEQGYALAQHELGLMYKTTKEFDKAEKWLTGAAKQGMKEAQFDLGFLYYSRAIWKKAAYWLNQAGKGSEPDYNALYYMGILWSEGHYVAESNANALICWRKAWKGLTARGATDNSQSLLNALAKKIAEAAESEAAEEQTKKKKKKTKKETKKENNKLYLRF